MIGFRSVQTPYRVVYILVPYRTGTCTGEHGVGTGKMKVGFFYDMQQFFLLAFVKGPILSNVMFLMQYLEKELGSGALRTMKRIKSALDPNDIMNPGKLIPPHVCI
ncbi:hypothetical protein GW17_00007587 [Ensete ventricosum]|nr:hypothetical protein GW17_00007587 [Ensete ventricosum]